MRFRHVYSTGPWDIEKFEVEDSTFGMVTLASGATLLVNATWAINMKENSRDGSLLYGIKGGTGLIGGELVVNKESNNRLWEITPNILGKTNESTYDREVASWVDCIENDTEPMVKAEEAAHVVKVLESIYTSARNGGKAITYLKVGYR